MRSVHLCPAAKAEVNVPSHRVWPPRPRRNRDGNLPNVVRRVSLEREQALLSGGGVNAGLGVQRGPVSPLGLEVVAAVHRGVGGETGNVEVLAAVHTLAVGADPNGLADIAVRQRWVHRAVRRVSIADGRPGARQRQRARLPAFGARRSQRDPRAAVAARTPGRARVRRTGWRGKAVAHAIGNGHDVILRAARKPVVESRVLFLEGAPDSPHDVAAGLCGALGGGTRGVCCRRVESVRRLI